MSRTAIASSSASSTKSSELRNSIQAASVGKAAASAWPHRARERSALQCKPKARMALGSSALRSAYWLTPMRQSLRPNASTDDLLEDN